MQYLTYLPVQHSKASMYERWDPSNEAGTMHEEGARHLPVELIKARLAASVALGY